MSTFSAVLVSLLICIAAAVLEGLFAGRNVNSFMARLRKPAFAPPLWLWAIIAVLYYAICFFILFRILRYDDNFSIRYTALALVVIMMAANAFWNFVFFRLENLFYSFALSNLYTLGAIALFVCLYQFDYLAAYSLVPYLLYLIYAFYWGFNLLKLNPRV